MPSIYALASLALSPKLMPCLQMPSGCRLNCVVYLGIESRYTSLAVYYKYEQD